jgi:hypothetical protein
VALPEGGLAHLDVHVNARVKKLVLHGPRVLHDLGVGAKEHCDLQERAARARWHVGRPSLHRCSRSGGRRAPTALHRPLLQLELLHLRLSRLLLLQLLLLVLLLLQLRLPRLLLVLLLLLLLLLLLRLHLLLCA